MLTNAVKDRGSPFRIPVFICGDQSNFDGRIVVLRKVDEANNFVQYHSDIRSDKIAKLKANQNAAMLFYDKEEKIQVRLKVECTCLLYTSPSPRDRTRSRMPSSA